MDHYSWTLLDCSQLFAFILKDEVKNVLLLMSRLVYGRYWMERGCWGDGERHAPRTERAMFEWLRSPYCNAWSREGGWVEKSDSDEGGRFFASADRNAWETIHNYHRGLADLLWEIVVRLAEAPSASSKAKLNVHDMIQGVSEQEAHRASFHKFCAVEPRLGPRLVPMLVSVLNPKLKEQLYDVLFHRFTAKIPNLFSASPTKRLNAELQQLCIQGPVNGFSDYNVLPQLVESDVPSDHRDELQGLAYRGLGDFADLSDHEGEDGGNEQWVVQQFYSTATSNHDASEDSGTEQQQRFSRDAAGAWSGTEAKRQPGPETSSVSCYRAFPDDMGYGRGIVDIGEIVEAMRDETWEKQSLWVEMLDKVAPMIQYDMCSGKPLAFLFDRRILTSALGPHGRFECSERLFQMRRWLVDVLLSPIGEDRKLLFEDMCVGRFPGVALAATAETSPRKCMDLITYCLAQACPVPHLRDILVAYCRHLVEDQSVYCERKDGRYVP